MSPYVLIYALFAYKFASSTFSWYVKRSTHNWEHRLKTFSAANDGKIIAGSGQDKILFIVVPSSGAGKAMKIYDECLEELQKRKESFMIEVYVTKSSDDVKTLLEHRRDDISAYYGIILLGGDSSITELIQGPLSRSKDEKWTYPPILHLPGGSTNLLSRMLHHGKSHTEIIQQFSADNVRRAGVIKVSSGDGRDNSVYATHIAFHGVGRHMLIGLEQHRHGLYAVFGALILPFIILKTLFFPPNKNEEPYFALMITNTRNFMGGEDTGFDIDLFDEKLLMVHLPQYRGAWHYIKTVMIDTIKGDTAKLYYDSALPEGMEVEMGTQFTVDEHDFHFILDGTTTVDLKGSPVTFTNLHGAIPYFVLSD